MSGAIDWLLASDEPWTRYRTLVDLEGLAENDERVQAARGEMLAHPAVGALVAENLTWGERPIKRHNDASHPIHVLSVLADLGVRADDQDMRPILDKVLAHQSKEGAYQSPLNIATAYGGTGEDRWSWILCDAPVVLHALLAMGLADEPGVRQAVDHLAALVDEGGWRCVAAPELGGFRGPGRRADPCPIANVYALKALSLAPDLLDSQATRQGAEMLLWHWEHQKERKLYLFGIGTDFRKLKYPFVWYDVLHVVDVLTRFPFVRRDSRLRAMLDTLVSQADDEGRYTAGSMYRAWKGWSFADKRNPSPGLTSLVLRARTRAGESG